MTKDSLFWTKVCIASIYLFWMFIGSAAYAQPVEDVDIDYERAQDSLHSENFPLAIEQLEALRKRDRNHAGALLDLAYLYCRFGKIANVEALLLTLESDFSPPPRIMDLIRELQQRDCSVAQDGTKWGGVFALGHSSNVNQGSLVQSLPLSSGLNLTLTDDFLPKSSPFVSLSAYFSHPLDGNNTSYGTFMSRQYMSASNYNLAGLSIGHIYSFSSKDLQISADVNASMRTLDGTLYHETLSGNLQLAPPATNHTNLPIGFDIRLAYSLYPTREGLDNLETTFLIPSRWQISDKASTRISAGWLFDKATGNRPGGNRTGPVLGAEAFYQFTSELKGYASWLMRRLQDESPYAPPLFEMVRKQRQQFISIAASTTLTKSSSLRVEFQYTNNADTIPIYRFSNNSFVVYWIWEGGK